MIKKQAPFRAIGIGMLALTLLAALLRSLAFATSFDPAVGHFNPGVFSTLLYITIALALVGVMMYVLLARRSHIASPCCPDHADCPVVVTVCAWVVVLICAATAVLDLFDYLRGNASTFILVRAVAAALSIPYFLFPSSASVRVFGLAAHIYCILALIDEYMDPYVVMSSPLKVMQQFALISFMLYLVMELYATCALPRPIRSTAFGLLAAFLCITNGLSCIVAGVIGGIIPQDYLTVAVVSLAFGLYTAARLHTATKLPNVNKTEDN